MRVFKNLSLLLMLFYFSTDVTSSQPTTIKIIGINDFHGQITEGRRSSDRPVGSAAVMAAYLKEISDNDTVITLMGDQVGASAPVSNLLNDEPTILFWNMLGKNCDIKNRYNTKCNIIATLGNHEFDKGQQNLFELINGTNKPPTDNWIDMKVFPGASFPYITANVVDKTGKTLFPPYLIKTIKNVPIGFIGIITKDSPNVIMANNIQGLKFLDEAQTINHYAAEMKAKGAKIIVVVMHEGGMQAMYDGDTKENTNVRGPILNIVKELSDDIDIIMAGHTHQFVNAYLENNHGKQILIAEANAYSTNLAEVTLTVDSKTNSILKKSARIITTFADQAPGNNPDKQVSDLVKLAEKKVDGLINRQIGTLKGDLVKKSNRYGESSIGNLLSDSFRIEMKSDIAFFNPGGIRSNLYAGKVTWGNLYAVLPFSNSAVKIAIKGKYIRAILEQQWQKDQTKMLQVSGIQYFYNMANPVGQRVVKILINKQPLNDNATYTVTTTNFVAAGGDGFSAFKKGRIVDVGPVDLNVLVSYIQHIPQPFSRGIEGRIKHITDENKKGGL